MRIAHFISHFPYREQFSNPDLARRYTCMGGEIAAYQLTKELARQGHEILVVTSSSGRQDEVERYDGLTIYRYASFGQVGQTRFSPGLNWGPQRDLPEVDLVHVHHTTPPGGLAGRLFAGRRKKPLVVTHHGFENPDRYGGLLRQGLVYLSAKYYVDWLFRSADALICISESYMDGSRFLKKYKDKVHVIPNGVDLDEFNTSQSKVQCRKRLGLDPEVPIVLFVGSLLPRKGVKELVESARQIMDLLPDFQMIFVGDGLLRSVLETRSSELGVRTHVHFSGFVSKPDERNAYYRAADVLVVPSIGDEMFPLVILEGFATGSALVVSDIKAFKSIVDHEENGLITTAGDPASLADAILRLFRSPDLRARISHNASALAERYSWTTVAARTAALYEAQRR